MNTWQKNTQSLAAGISQLRVAQPVARRPRQPRSGAEGSRRMSTIKIAAVCLILSLWGAVAYAGTVTYVYSDPQGTPLAEADASGNITARFDYTPYGVAVASMSPAPNGPGYTGHVNDPDTGFVYMQARYYDPSTGRFLSIDPVGPSPGNLFNLNRYDYANNNPINHTDPDGRCADGASCDQMVQSYGAWANANPEEADKIGRDVGVPAVSVMLAVTGAPEAVGVASVMRAVAGKIVGVIARRAATKLAAKIPTMGKEGSNGVREVKGGVTEAKKMFDTLRGTNKAEEVKPGVSIAKGPNGKTVTFRSSSKSGPPTVDVHGVVEGVRKVKFKDPGQ
jgi:RHS repeat-associated protein